MLRTQLALSSYSSAPKIKEQTELTQRVIYDNQSVTLALFQTFQLDCFVHRL